MNQEDEEFHRLLMESRWKCHLTKERIEAQKRAFQNRLRLNSALKDNKYWFLPVDNVEHGNYVPVGRGNAGSRVCGHCVGLIACHNLVGHKGKAVNGMDATGKSVVRPRHLWCHKSSCPVCFIRGWAVREATNIVGRLNAAEKRGLGKIEHITVSPKEADHNSSEYVLRMKCRTALLDRGVEGGTMIFHGFRIARTGDIEFLAWSPHYHTLGVVHGGFDRCRNCVHEYSDCEVCDGFKGREVRGFKSDGYLVKVHEERLSVFGTAWYQLNHATIRIGLKRFHVATWFGSMGNRKFKGEVLRSSLSCPVCSGEMEKAYYIGDDVIVRNTGHPAYKKIVLRNPFDDHGDPNFVDKGGGKVE